jgi:hypothetical protein
VQLTIKVMLPRHERKGLFRARFRIHVTPRGPFLVALNTSGIRRKRNPAEGTTNAKATAPSDDRSRRRSSRRRRRMLAGQQSRTH